MTPSCYFMLSSCASFRNQYTRAHRYPKSKPSILQGWTCCTTTERADRAGLALQEGYGEFQVTHSKGERADCFRMYLKPILGRSNLTVLTDAKTLKVETEEAAGTTVTKGVTFQQAGPDGSKLQGELPGLLCTRPRADVRQCCRRLQPLQVAGKIYKDAVPSAAELVASISFALAGGWRAGRVPTALLQIRMTPISVYSRI